MANIDSYVSICKCILSFTIVFQSKMSFLKCMSFTAQDDVCWWIYLWKCEFSFVLIQNLILGGDPPIRGGGSSSPKPLSTFMR